MYKVLIVDDEPLIREGLKCFIDWEDKGFTVVGEAANGDEAVEIFMKNPADVVFTDIRMPKTDGFELIDRLHESGQYPKIVILSGYNDFEYARGAINREAIGYILKPFQEEELIAILEKVREKLNDVREESKKYFLSDSIIRQFKTSEENRRIILPMLRYMEDNLRKETLFEDMSGEFSLSTNYISSLMKEQLGHGFLHWLTFMRIERAKELLRKDLALKTYEIAGLVGYEDPQYFSRLFRKKVGVTPKEYREGNAE